MADFDWKEKYKSKVTTAETAMKLVKSGDNIFIGTACAQPQHLVAALVEHSAHIYDAHIVHLLTMGTLRIQRKIPRKIQNEIVLHR